MEFLDLLQRVTEAFEAVHIDFVVVGGVAVIIKGEPRTTRDIDVIMENRPSKLRAILRSLEAKDVKGLQGCRRKLKDHGRATLLDQRSSLTVDLKMATNRIDHLALSQKRTYSYQGLDIPIPPPELILLGKLQYLGDITQEKRKFLLKISDVTDFIAVFNRNKQEIDTKWLKDEAKKRGLRPSFERLTRLAKETDPKQYQ